LFLLEIFGGTQKYFGGTPRFCGTQVEKHWVRLLRLVSLGQF
jgi:hypothetical protein